MTTKLSSRATALADDVVIDHFGVTWHAPEGLDGDRFDRLVAQLLDGPLEDALAQAGVASSELVCLRSVEVPPHQVSWHLPDAEVVARWSGSIGVAVAEAVAARSNDEALVRYSSLGQAVTDVVLRVAVGDLTRAWAWSQIGLWPPAAGASASSAADTDVSVVFEVLAQHPDLAPAALRELAVRGSLASFLARVPAERIVEVSRAAWAAVAGVAWELPAATDIGHADLAQADAVVAKSRLASVARRVVRADDEQLELRWAWSVLVVLEVEPSIAALGSRSEALVAAVGRLLGSSSSGSTAAPEAQVVGPDDLASDRDERPVVDTAISSGDLAPSPSPAPDGTGHGLDQASARGDHTDAEDERSTATDRDDGAVEPIISSSRWGGLLFLLHLVDGVDLAARVADRSDLGSPGLRSVLHAMGMAVIGRAVPDATPPDGDDPAALAFAGLAPTSDVPEPPDDGSSAAALRTFVDQEVDAVVGRLRDRMRAAELELVPEPALLLRVIRRRVVVIADPGWIDLGLELDEVDTAIRRAGLDLDLGFVPWLGVVVRFTYG